MAIRCANCSFRNTGNLSRTRYYLAEWDAVGLLYALGVNVPTCTTNATCTSSQCCYVVLSLGFCVNK